jgi:hypothetical protein
MAMNQWEGPSIEKNARKDREGNEKTRKDICESK